MSAQALTIRLRLREHEPHLVLRFQHPHDSYFEGGELASSGLPQGKELEILEQYRGQAAAGTVHAGIQAAGLRSPQAERKNLRQAVDLFAKAGWVIKGGKMVNAKTGEQFKFEILGWNEHRSGDRQPLYRQSAQDRHRRFPAHCRTSQYVNRLPHFDFDVRDGAFGQSNRPETSSATSGVQGRRHAGVAQSDGHQGSDRRRADRPRHLRHGPRRPCRRHTMRSTGCCCGTSTSCRNITGRPSGWPIGTSSASRTSSRAYLGADTDPGGSIRPRKRRLPPSTRAAIDAGCSPAAASWRWAGRRLLRCCRGGLRRHAPAEQPLHGLVGLRRPQISSRISRISTTSIRMRPRAACSICRRPTGSTTRSPSTFNTLNYLHAQGRCAAAHGAVLRCADDARARRAGRASTACSPKSVTMSADRNRFDFALQAEGALPRRLAADRRGRCLRA